jgi:hypothetical protein
MIFLFHFQVPERAVLVTIAAAAAATTGIFS